MSALDDLIADADARLHGEKLRHLDGRRSRVARQRRARAELHDLRARIAELEMITYKTMYFMGGSMLKHHGVRLVLTSKGRRTE